MGGYLATRGALDQRIRACIPNSLIVDCGAAARAGMKGLLKNTIFMDAAFKLIMKVNTPARWGFQHSEWTLAIRQRPRMGAGLSALHHQGSHRPLPPPDAVSCSARTIFTTLPHHRPTSSSTCSTSCSPLNATATSACSPAAEGASSHCQMGGLSYAQAAIFDWLNHIFDAGPAPAARRARRCRPVHPPIRQIRKSARRNQGQSATRRRPAHLKPTSPPATGAARSPVCAHHTTPCSSSATRSNK